ncbi:MAG: hypothetical protein OEY44_00090 [Candidatus Peregrinibacteria bacterium]|nr:hypothetical protein [Candidatus Peregrinibacteria bacterium]
MNPKANYEEPIISFAETAFESSRTFLAALDGTGWKSTAVKVPVPSAEILELGEEMREAFIREQRAIGLHNLLVYTDTHERRMKAIDVLCTDGNVVSMLVRVVAIGSSIEPEDEISYPHSTVVRPQDLWERQVNSRPGQEEEDVGDRITQKTLVRKKKI